MPDAIHFRILGYMTTIVLHVANAVIMMSSFRDDDIKEVEIRHYQKMQPFFFTCWTFFFQVVFSGLSLYCDVQIMRNTKNKAYRLPEILEKARVELFNTIVWPASTLVFTMFWLFYAVDRDLIYPTAIDKAISPTSNHIMHTYIFPFVLWEMMFYYRERPANVFWRAAAVISLEVIYFLTLIFVKMYFGVWIYPFFGKINELLIIPGSFTIIALFLYGTQKLQWILYSMLWEGRRKPIVLKIN
uniref:Androgen-dependent TFPI-regulating protein-like n=2 Tax=Bombyx mori TaxID=7091 RepID=A0A8R2GCY2_BOMMO|nr:androgen-dependent TFPI-regulating protein [Bombyx mori]